MVERDKIAVLAGGCFWGVQDLIRELPGVVSTRVGYTGGRNAHPTYRNHPGHAEAVEITYRPDKIDYRTLLEYFFQIHDPSTIDRQGNDVGSSYRSAIFYLDDDQRRTALKTIADINESARSSDSGARRVRRPGDSAALPAVHNLTDVDSTGRSPGPGRR